MGRALVVLFVLWVPFEAFPSEAEIPTPPFAKISSGTIEIGPDDARDSRSARYLDDNLFDFEALSTDPAAKKKWKFMRVAPDTVDGPVPLVLLHGLSTDFWGNFEEWAASSAEAAEFRKRFQLWKNLTPTEGINCAVGFSSQYPGFEESLGAYLKRFIDQARSEGVVAAGGRRYVFPDGPYCLLTHSQGGVTARAFLCNFPDEAERVVGVVTLSAPHMGSPGATPEWVRYTLASMGLARPAGLSQVVRGALAEFVVNGYLSTQRQSDMDMGWANYDARGGYGMPLRTFSIWRPGGVQRLTLSPRDANRTNARTKPGFDDRTFEPAHLLSTYCGGLDAITPNYRGGLYLDRFFLYGAYVEPDENLGQLVRQTLEAQQRGDANSYYHLALRATAALMGRVESNRMGPPAGAYLLNDGFVPLQSQLFLDGRESNQIYRTLERNAVEFPVRPIRPRRKLINKHTLANPDRLRILPGWNHYETVTGRYDPVTRHSDLFVQVAADLLDVTTAK